MAANPSTDVRTPLLKNSSDEELFEVADFEDVGVVFGSRARQELERGLLRKLDKRMSILVVIYILNFIDRNNAGAARLRGFEEDLHLKGQQFATLLSILYVGYISMQIPSNMFLSHIGKPSIYLPTCMVVWGFVSVMTGFTTSFYGALFTRLFLGIVEASFFPGALFLISKWYKHDELGLRTAILFCGNIISNAFGALIASAILDNMQGVLGRAAWRWLFYVEGSLTVLVAVCAMFVLPDFPETTSPGWLSAKEISLAIKRMEEDTDLVHGREAESLSSGFWMAIQDRNVWLLTCTMACQIVTVSFTAYFPTLTATLGYSRTISLLLCAPPYLISAVLAFFWSRHSDKTRERFYHISIPLCVGIFGFLIAACTMNTAARYLSMFLTVQSYAGVCVLYGWLSNTFPSPPAKRAVALAFINSFSQVGNITGSYVWPYAWGPTYQKSYLVCTASASSCILLCYILKRRLTTLNRKLAREELDRDASEVGFRYLL